MTTAAPFDSVWAIRGKERSTPCGPMFQVMTSLWRGQHSHRLSHSSHWSHHATSYWSRFSLYGWQAQLSLDLEACEESRLPSIVVLITRERFVQVANIDWHEISECAIKNTTIRPGSKKPFSFSCISPFLRFQLKDESSGFASGCRGPQCGNTPLRKFVSGVVTHSTSCRTRSR
jgi:hypothetical protein